MKRRRERAGGPPDDERRRPAEGERSVGLIGAAVHAPLSQGRDGSFPLELEGDDLAEPFAPDFEHELIRGEPIEPVIHAPTTDHIEPRPVATGECTVLVLEGESPCVEEDER